MDPLITRADLIRQLLQMADTNWCGSRTDRMRLAATAAEALEMYGQSADDTQKKLVEIHAKLDALLAR